MVAFCKNWSTDFNLASSDYSLDTFHQYNHLYYNFSAFRHNGKIDFCVQKSRKNSNLDNKTVFDTWLGIVFIKNHFLHFNCHQNFLEALISHRLKKYYFRLKGVEYQKLVIFTLLTLKMTKLFNCLGIEL